MQIGTKVKIEGTEIEGFVYDVGKNNPALTIVSLDIPQKASSKKGKMVHCLLTVHSSLLIALD